MKKFLMFCAIALSMAISANAQTAIEKSKLLDNTYVGIGGGVYTPLAFDHVFPLNPTATVTLGKKFTPVVGAEVEGTAWFGSHSAGSAASRFDDFNGNVHNAFRGTFVGVNGTVNLTNLLLGYKGEPRFFEVGTVTGLGWLHTYTPYKGVEDRYHNYLGLKTGVDLFFNLGKTKAHTVRVQPAVTWNLSEPGTSGGTLAFNKKGAQFGVTVGYQYNFKNSNGLRYFKVYDIECYEATINNLNKELKACQDKKPEVIEKVVEKIVYVKEDASVTVYFAYDSDEINDAAKETLDTVKKGTTVNVEAYASPEGSDEYNLKLSQRRADAVAKYLEDNGVKVESATGKGATSEESPRAAVVTKK